MRRCGLSPISCTMGRASQQWRGIHTGFLRKAFCLSHTGDAHILVLIVAFGTADAADFPFARCAILFVRKRFDLFGPGDIFLERIKLEPSNITEVKPASSASFTVFIIAAVIPMDRRRHLTVLCRCDHRGPRSSSGSANVLLQSLHIERCIQLFCCFDRSHGHLHIRYIKRTYRMRYVQFPFKSSVIFTSVSQPSLFKA